MADLNRNDDSMSLIVNDNILLREHKKIQMNEKLNSLKQMDVRLHHIQYVEVKQLELKKATLLKEIDLIQKDLDGKVINT